MRDCTFETSKKFNMTEQLQLAGIIYELGLKMVDGPKCLFMTLRGDQNGLDRMSDIWRILCREPINIRSTEPRTKRRYRFLTNRHQTQDAIRALRFLNIKVKIISRHKITIESTKEGLLVAEEVLSECLDKVGLLLGDPFSTEYCLIDITEEEPQKPTRSCTEFEVNEEVIVSLKPVFDGEIGNATIVGKLVEQRYPVRMRFCKDIMMIHRFDIHKVPNAKSKSEYYLKEQQELIAQLRNGEGH